MTFIAPIRSTAKTNARAPDPAPQDVEPLCGPDCVALALRRPEVMKPRFPDRPDMARLFAEEAERSLRALPAIDVLAAVSHWIDGTEGPGDGTPPSLTELRRTAEAIAVERGKAIADGRAARAAQLRAQMGEHPVFVRADSPQWAAWAAHRRANGQPPPVARSTKNGMGWYFPAPAPG